MDCGHCEKPLPRNGRYLTCKGCEVSYHFERPCSTYTEDSWSTIGQKRKDAYRCALCKQNVNGTSPVNLKTPSPPKPKPNASPNSGNNTDLSTIMTALKDMQKILVEVRDEQKDIRESVDFLSEKFEEIKVGQRQNEREIEELKTRLKEKEDVIDNLHNKLVETELYVRNRNIEIHGVAEHKEENVEEIICKVAKAVGVELSGNDIEAAHRVPTRKPGVPKPIVAQLSSRKKRNEIVAKRREEIYNHQVNHTGEGTGKVFIYEQLPAQIKDLMWKTKVQAKKKNWKYVWQVKGKVLAKKDDHLNPVRIVYEKDIELIK